MPGLARRFRPLLAAVVAAALAALAAPGVAGAAAGDYIVVFHDSVSQVNAKTDGLEHAAGFNARFRYRHALRGFAAHLNEVQLARLQADPDVAFVSEDRPVHAVGTVALAAGEPVPPTGVRRIEAASSTAARQASSVAVAVIDTGIDLTHPDFTGPGGSNVASGKNCVTSGAAANDDNGHGSHVAGTIGAQNNGTGVLGVAPGTRMYAVKVLNAQGSGSWSQVVCGIDWVTANTTTLGIKVANMSLGGTGFADGFCGELLGDALEQAICRSTDAGVNYVVAAGNDGQDFSTFTPAAYPEVLTATAMSDSNGAKLPAGSAPTCRTGELDDRYASFSNFADPTDTGGKAHMIAGPGVCIRSTWKTGLYNTISGTSMASPHVAGSVALCFGEGGSSGPCTGMTPPNVIDQMRQTAATHTAADANYGFTGDPSHAVAGKYFGNLVWDGPIGSSGPPPPAADFTISAAPPSQSVAHGSSTAYSVTIGPQNGFSGSVSLSVANLPPRVSASFSPNPATGSSTLTVTANRKARPATRTLTITGTSGGLSHTAQVVLSVT